MVLIAMYLRVIVAFSTPESMEVDLLGRVYVEALLFVSLFFGMFVGLVAATSIRDGGPMRLFIAGVILSALPIAVAFRAPIDGG